MMLGFLVALCAYLLGSIPSGFIAGKIRGVDIRTVGSGNIGATNAFRILGKTAGTIVLVADGLKGWFSAAILPDIVFHLLHLGGSAEGVGEIYRVIGGVVAVLGHNFTFWLNFKGGKGVATSAGVLAALAPISFVAVVSVWIIVCWLSRYVSLASITAAVVLPFASWLAGYSVLIISITGLMAVLSIIKHRSNIQRLLNGTENKIRGRNAVENERAKV